jgi:hypothetical protein
MVSVLALSVVDRGLQPLWGQTKNYEIGICCFSSKHSELREKSKDWITRKQNNVSQWSAMSTCGVLFQWTGTIKKPTQCIGLEQCGPYHQLIDTCSRIYKAEKLLNLR